MILRLAKTDDGPVTLTFIRDDGSSTSRVISAVFVSHEFMHYAVESVLGIENGMLGLIARGREVEEFDAAARNWLPLEAHHAEVIVGALEAEVFGSALPQHFQDNLEAICTDVAVPPPSDISDDRLASVRQEFKALREQWDSLPTGSIFELPWRD